MTLRGADAPRQSTTGMALGRLTSVECAMLAYCFRTSSRGTTSDDFRVNALKRSSWRSVVSLVVVLMLWFVACITKTCNHSRRPPGSRDLSTLSSSLYPPLHQPRSQLELTPANSRLLIEHEHPYASPLPPTSLRRLPFTSPICSGSTCSLLPWPIHSPTYPHVAHFRRLMSAPFVQPWACFRLWAA